MDELHHVQVSLHNASVVPASPVLSRESSLHAAHHMFIDDFHSIQQHLIANTPVTPAVNINTIPIPSTEHVNIATEPIEFEGDNLACSICLDESENEIPVLRLVCRHIFHIQCWHENLLNGDGMECPNCRGAGRVIARWRFVAPPLVVFQEENFDAEVSVASGALSRTSSFQSSTSVMQRPAFLAPWWPRQEELHHTSTQLSGHLSILVDPGAWTNLIGGKLAKALAQKALDAGHHPRQWPVSQPLHVAGVGNGFQTAEWCVRFPIAIESRDSDAAHLHAYESPVVEGGGDDLPGLLGLRSMKSQQGVLEMTDGEKMLTFPGPGGYQIVWSPGSTHIPLRTAPSGHLVFIVDAFGRVRQTTGGVPSKSMTLHANAAACQEMRPAPEQSSSSSSAAPPSGSY